MTLDKTRPPFWEEGGGVRGAPPAESLLDGNRRCSEDGTCAPVTPQRGSVCRKCGVGW